MDNGVPGNVDSSDSRSSIGTRSEFACTPSTNVVELRVSSALVTILGDSDDLVDAFVGIK